MSVTEEILSELDKWGANTAPMIAMWIQRPEPSVRRTLNQLNKEGRISLIRPAIGHAPDQLAMWGTK